MPTLLTLLESPGIHIALGIGIVQAACSARAAVGHRRGGREAGRTRSLRGQLHEVLTARSMVLLVGGLLVGFLMGE